MQGDRKRTKDIIIIIVCIILAVLGVIGRHNLKEPKSIRSLFNYEQNQE